MGIKNTISNIGKPNYEISLYLKSILKNEDIMKYNYNQYFTMR